MNPLPLVFRQTHQPFAIKRQGPEYSLRLEKSSMNTLQSETERSSLNNKTRLRVNRYSLEGHRKSSHRVARSTIAYEYLDDPEFSSNKPRYSIDSWHDLLSEKQRSAEVVGLKVEGLKGISEEYKNDLRAIKNEYLEELGNTEHFFRKEIASLRELLSSLRRETGGELKKYSKEVKHIADEFIQYCGEVTKTNKKYEKCVSSLQTL